MESARLAAVGCAPRMPRAAQCSQRPAPPGGLSSAPCPCGEMGAVAGQDGGRRSRVRAGRVLECGRGARLAWLPGEAECHWRHGERLNLVKEDQEQLLLKGVIRGKMRNAF